MTLERLAELVAARDDITPVQQDERWAQLRELFDFASGAPHATDDERGETSRAVLFCERAIYPPEVFDDE